MKPIHCSRILPIVIAAAMTSSGCTSLINPHVDWSTVEQVRASGGQTTPTGSATIDEAFAYSERAIRAYKSAMGDQAALTTGTGALLIPMAAAIIGYGIKDVHHNSITNLAVGASAGYGMSTWLSSPGRGGIYAAGITALVCARQVMIPYRPNQTWKYAFASARKTMSDREGELRIAHLTLQGKLEAYGGKKDALSTEATDLLTATNEELATTNRVRGEIAALYHRIESAGPRLEETVRRVGAAVDTALLATVPNLSELSAILTGMTNNVTGYRSLATPTETPAPAANEEAVANAAGQGTSGDQSADPAKPVKDAITDTRKKQSALAIAREELAAFLVPYQGETEFSRLESCVSDQAKLAKPLSALPSGDITVKAGAPATTIYLSGGNGQYAIAGGTGPDGLVITQPQAFGSRIDITAAKGTPAHTYNIQAQDGAGQSLLIKVIVTGAEEAVVNKPEEPKLNAFEAGLNETPNDVYPIQTALNVCNATDTLAVDGQIGANTKAAAKQCTDVDTTELSADNVNSLLATHLPNGLPPLKAVTAFELAATPADLDTFYGLITSLTSPGSTAERDAFFTKAFRNALLEFQKSEDTANEDKLKLGPSGLYTKATKHRLEAKAPGGNN